MINNSITTAATNRQLWQWLTELVYIYTLNSNGERIPSCTIVNKEEMPLCIYDYTLEEEEEEEEEEKSKEEEE